MLNNLSKENWLLTQTVRTPYKIMRLNKKYFPDNVILTDEQQQQMDEYIRARRLRKAGFRRRKSNIINDTKSKTKKYTSKKGHA